MSSTTQDMLSKLFLTIEDFFALDPSTVTSETTSSDVDGWDSIAHVSLLMEIERAFHIELPPEETSGAADVGALAHIIAAHLPK